MRMTPYAWSVTANTTRSDASQPPVPPTSAPDVPVPAPYSPIGRIPVIEVFPVRTR